jgi:hypothetical protein
MTRTRSTAISSQFVYLFTINLALDERLILRSYARPRAA